MIYTGGWKKKCKTLAISYYWFGRRVIKITQKYIQGRNSHFFLLKLLHIFVYPYFSPFIKENRFFLLVVQIFVKY